jgi:hypothetical protein
LQGLAKPAIKTNIRITNFESEQIDPIGTDDPPGFEEAFSSCVFQIRAVGEAILNDQKSSKLGNLMEWKSSKMKEFEADELLQFIRNWRRHDFHSSSKSSSSLTFVMQAYAISLSNSTTGAPPEPGATLLLNEKGLYWRIEQGTAREHEVPYVPRPGFYVTVAVPNPPATHQGKPLPSRDPVTLCALAEKFYAEMLFEAKTKFAK